MTAVRPHRRLTALHAGLLHGLLAGLLVMLPWPLPGASGNLTSTVQPFEKGDILVAATIMDDPDDDHAGTGRLIQYDADLRPKGELYLKGTRHGVGGLAFAPDGTLWGFSQLTPAVVEITPDGQQKPLRRFSDRSYSNVAFGRDGTLYFGEHLMGTSTGHPALTTTFRLLPGRDVIGDGWVFRHAPDGRLIREYRTPATGGLSGFLGVTSIVLADQDSRLIYLSETGRKVMQYDLRNDRQLPDLKDFGGDPDVPMVLVTNHFPDGRLLVSTGQGFLVLDPSSGQVLRRYPLEGAGWAAIAPSVEGHFALVGNFFSGEILKVRLADGVIMSRANVGQKRSLSGIAQFPGQLAATTRR